MMYVVVIDVRALINKSYNTPNKCKNVIIIYIFIYLYLTCAFVDFII